MDLVGFLYGFGVLHGVILAGILLFARSGHRLANGFMAGLVVMIGLNLLQSWLLRTGFYVQRPAGAFLIPPLDFTWGPLLYLYAYSLTNQPVSWRHIAHFIPPLLLLVVVNTSFWSYPAEEQRSVVSYVWSTRSDEALGLQVAGILPPFWGAWVDFHLHSSFFSLQFGIYCFLVLRRIRHHNDQLQQHFSSLEQMNLRWLRSLTLACLLFLVVFLIFNRLQLILVGHFDVNSPTLSTPSVFLVFLVYIIGISAIFQPNLIRGVVAAMDSDPNQTLLPAVSERPQASAPVTESATEMGVAATEQAEEAGPAAPTRTKNDKTKTDKYQRSRVSLADAEKYKIRLMQAMQEKELYLDSELTLPDLAKYTGLTPHQVSQVINGQMSQNFFSFVNNYRIQLAKKLMSEPDTRNMPIVELAVEVGFKSKSSFYDAFKKATQITPTQFKKTVEA